MIRTGWLANVGSWRFWFGAGLVTLALIAALVLEGEPGRCLRRARDCSPIVGLASTYAVAFLVLPGAALVVGLTAPTRPAWTGLALGAWNAVALLVLWIVARPELMWFTSDPVRLGLEVWAAVALIVVLAAVITSGLLGRVSGAVLRRLRGTPG